MKKVTLNLLLISFICICFCGNASAELQKIRYRGDLVIYDTFSGLYWYPYIVDFIGMTKGEQLNAILLMDYAGSSDWYMASYFDTTLLKQSLAMMANKDVIPTTFESLGDIDTELRGPSSPILAYKVRSTKFFTPTGYLPEGAFWSGDTPAYVFNGRTDTGGGGGITRGVPSSEGLTLSNNADDHWVAHSLLTRNTNFRTMLFNYDQHYLADDATSHYPFPGEVGAWVVTRSIGNRD